MIKFSNFISPFYESKKDRIPPVLGRVSITQGGVLVNIDIAINMDTFLNSLGIIELPVNCVVVISEGKAKLRELPEHGEYKIVTHQGKVRRMRREEGEEF